MWHKPCRTFNPWCLCIKTRCLSYCVVTFPQYGSLPLWEWAEKSMYCCQNKNALIFGSQKLTEILSFWMCMVGWVCANQIHVTSVLNTLKPEQNGCRFANYIFKCIFLKERCGILIKISLKFVSKGLIDSKSILVQAVAWHQTGDKLLSEPLLTMIPESMWCHQTAIC